MVSARGGDDLSLSLSFTYLYLSTYLSSIHPPIHPSRLTWKKLHPGGKCLVDSEDM